MSYREIRVRHSGGFGVGWIAIAIVLVCFIGLFGAWKRIDCSLGIEKACQRIEQFYINQELQELEALKNE